MFVLLRYTRLRHPPVSAPARWNLETVAALGINVQRVRSLNFAVGIFLAGLSGIIAARAAGDQPTMGTGLLMPTS